MAKKEKEAGREEVRYDFDALKQHEKLRPYGALLEALIGKEQQLTVNEALEKVKDYLSKEVK